MRTSGSKFVIIRRLRCEPALLVKGKRTDPIGNILPSDMFIQAQGFMRKGLRGRGKPWYQRSGRRSGLNRD